MLSEELNISKTAFREILLEELRKRKLNGTIVLRSLTQEQEEDHSAIRAEFLETTGKDDTCCSSIIAADETWCLQCDPQTKRQSVEWKGTNSLVSKKPRAQSSKRKTILIAFFDCRGVVHKEFVPQSQTVNQDVYKGVLQLLRHSIRLDSIRRCNPEVWTTGKWFLLHDSARPHTALSVK